MPDLGTGCQRCPCQHVGVTRGHLDAVSLSVKDITQLTSHWCHGRWCGGVLPSGKGWVSVVLGREGGSMVPKNIVLFRELLGARPFRAQLRPSSVGKSCGVYLRRTRRGLPAPRTPSCPWGPPGRKDTSLPGKGFAVSVNPRFRGDAGGLLLCHSQAGAAHCPRQHLAHASSVMKGVLDHILPDTIQLWENYLPPSLTGRSMAEPGP